MANLGQHLTKKIKITPRTQRTICAHLAYLLCPGGCRETHRYIHTYKKCKITKILVADSGSLEPAELSSPCK